MKSIGFLLCLISLYLMNPVWGPVGLAVGAYLFPAGALVAFIGILKEFDKEDKAKKIYNKEFYLIYTNRALSSKTIIPRT